MPSNKFGIILRCRLTGARIPCDPANHHADDCKDRQQFDNNLAARDAQCVPSRLLPMK
ncbi:MAG: hypothetical protein ACWA5W_03730 [Phycisphaerales bacterium]